MSVIQIQFLEIKTIMYCQFYGMLSNLISSVLVLQGRIKVLKMSVNTKY